MSKPRSKTTAEARKEKVEKALKTLGQNVYQDLDSGKFPSVTFASRSVRNIVYDKKLQQFILGSSSVRRSAGNIKHIRPFTQLLWLAFFSRKLVAEKRTSTLRDVYYSAQAFNVEFMDQAESDELITDLEVLLESAREEFNVFPEERSAIFGNLTVEYTVKGYEGKRLDLSSHPDGMMIGPALTTAEFRDTDAEMVLAIEKGGLFTRFIEEKVHEKYKAILVNTAGQPPRSTRYLLRRLHQELKLPIGILCDADPWGAHIAMVIKSGSAAAAHLRDLTTPSAVWLGVWASVTGDEPVIIERDGLIRNEAISELYDSVKSVRDSTEATWPAATKVNALCCSSSGRLGVMPVSAFTKHKYSGDLYEIRTPGGFSVKTTGNHSIEVFDRDSFSFQSKPVDQLAEGDLVASCFRLPNNESLKEINLAQAVARECPQLAEDVFVEGEQADDFARELRTIYPKKILREQFYQVLKHGGVKLSYFLKEGRMPSEGRLRLRYSTQRLPVVITQIAKFGRLMGYHAAEGGFSAGSKTGCCELTFASSEQEYVNDALDCMSASLGIRGRVEARHHATRIRYGNSLLVRIVCDALRAGDGVRSKRVPFVFLNTPDLVKTEFLRGCFRGDRTVNYDVNTRLSLKTVSRTLASDLVVLLRQLDCVAYVWKSGTAYVVSCAEASGIQDLVNEICRKPTATKSKIQSMPGDLVYGLRDEMRRRVPRGAKTALHQLLFTGHGSTSIGYERLAKGLEMLEAPLEDERLKTLSWLVENKIVLLPVKSVANLGRTSQPVYDLEVEGVHTFVGGVGGLLLHNSDIVKYKLPSDPLTEIDIKRLYELKADPRYKDRMWHEELDTFLRIKKKSEQEAFSRYGLSYIVDTYLPDKIQLLKSQ